MIDRSLFLRSLFFATLAIPASASAAKLASLCHALDKAGSELTIRGEKEDKRLPIASVSKIMTGWWALIEKGSDYRFRTIFHVTPVSDKTVDVHLEGARDPYFGKETLHLALSELHKKGVRNIDRFTFDENFKFYWNVTSSDVAIGHYGLESPRPETVQRQLRLNGSMLHGYETTRKQARERGVELVTKPDISIKTLAPLAFADFKPTENTQSFLLSSASLISLIKEMNRNSNNHAANQIFQHLGGAEAFQRFAQSRLALGEDHIRFINGSGDRLDINEVGTYNEATCSAVIRILKDFRAFLKKENRDLKDVMAVSGVDRTSTTHRIYNNDTTEEALVAKTGTVNPDVTLAGIAHTQDGDLYFMINMATNGTSRDWRSARQKIRTEITKLIETYDGGKPVSVKSVQFFSVDKHSIFVDEGGDDDEVTP